MNLILLEDARTNFFAAGTPAAEHLLRVLKVRTGSVFWCGVKNGARGTATVRKISPEGGVGFSVAWEPAALAPALPPARLLVGLSRPQTMKKVFAAAAELGCSRIDVFACEKGDPAYAESSLWKRGDATLEKILEKSAEQTCVPALPAFALHASLGAALAAGVPAAGAAEERRVALDVYEAEGPFGRAFFSPGVPVALAVGPERGWSAAERAALRGNGFAFAHLGERVLRVETAVAAALSVALVESGFWRQHRGPD